MGAEFDVAHATDGLGLVAMLRGELDEAERLVRDSLATFEARGAYLRSGGALNTLGWIARVRSDLAAEELTERGVRWLEEIGFGDSPSTHLIRMHARYALGRLVEAEELGRAGLAAFGDGAAHVGADVARLLLARTLIRRGSIGEVPALVTASLRPAWDTERPRIVADAAVTVAQLAVARGRLDLAAGLLAAALSSPATEGELRREAVALAERHGIDVDTSCRVVGHEPRSPDGMHAVLAALAALYDDGTQQ